MTDDVHGLSRWRSPGSTTAWRPAAMIWATSTRKRRLSATYQLFSAMRRRLVVTNVSSDLRTLASLWTAIETRTVIGPATGIVMERHRLSSDRAFAMVVKLSQELNMKARDIARRIVAIAHQPAAITEPPPSPSP